MLVEGRDLAALDRAAAAALRRRSVGYVFQDFNLIPALTAAENVALPRELDGVSARRAREQAVAALDRLGIAELADRFPDDMSGGQQQRVAIARAIVGERRLLLADEPTGALDSETGEAVLRLVRARCDDGVAGVLVTHEARLAGWADRIVFLRDGVRGRRDPAAAGAGVAARTGPVIGARWRPALRIARRTARRAPGRTVLVAALVAAPVLGATFLSTAARTAELSPAEKATRALGAADARLEITPFAVIGALGTDGYGAIGDPPKERDPGSVRPERLLPARQPARPGRHPDHGAVPHRRPGHGGQRRGGGHPGADDGGAAPGPGRPVAGRSRRAGAVPVAGRPARRPGRRPGAADRRGPGDRGRPGRRAVLPVLPARPRPARLDRRRGRVDPLPGPAARGHGAGPGAARPAGLLRRAADPARRVPAPRALGRPHHLRGRTDTAALGVVLLVAGIGLFEVVLLAGTAFAVAARRQVRDVALVLSNGGRRADVRRMLLAHGVVLGVLGAVAGVGLGVVAVLVAWPGLERLADQDFGRLLVSPRDLAVVALVGLLSGLAAAVVPAWSASRVPVDAGAGRTVRRAVGGRPADRRRRPGAGGGRAGARRAGVVALVGRPG